MSHNILVTGGSGYLGGSLLASWQQAQITGYDHLFALVRTDSQAESVKRLYGAEPVKCSLDDDRSISVLIVNRNITIVLYLIDAYKGAGATAFMKALSEVKKTTSKEVHFIFVSGKWIVCRNRYQD